MKSTFQIKSPGLWLPNPAMSESREQKEKARTEIQQAMAEFKKEVLK